MTQPAPSSKSLEDLALTGRLAALVAKYGVPGASLAVFHDGALAEAAAGVVNLNTQVPATPDTLFQIGSITKLYTAVLVLQLVDEGKLSLDAPVRDILPDFQLGDAEATQRLTLRHLLSHTGGLDGDFFFDAGRGEERVARYVAGLKDLPNVAPLGVLFSYSNIGFIIAGRMIEVTTGLTWDKAVRTRLAKPLGTPGFSTLPEQAMRYLTAIGHIDDGAGALRVSPLAFLAQSNGPAGATPMACARDIVTFARMLLAGGIAPDGAQIVSAQSVAEMNRPQIVCPAGLRIEALGLALFLWDTNGDGTYGLTGHDGSTIGQAAWLRSHPASGTIAVLLTNGGNGKALYQDLFGSLFAELADVRLPGMPEATPGLALDLSRYVGRYRRHAGALRVDLKEGALFCTGEPAADYALFNSARTVPLAPVSDSLFVGPTPDGGQDTYHFLMPDENNVPQILHMGVRAHRREG